MVNRLLLATWLGVAAAAAPADPPVNFSVRTASYFSYRETARRALAHYQAAVGPELATLLAAGGLWFDGGSGLGLAGQERALRAADGLAPRLRIVAVNHQPFFAEVRDYLRALSRATHPRAFRLTEREGASGETVCRVVRYGERDLELDPIGYALDIPPLAARGRDVTDDEVRAHAARFLARMDAALRHGFEPVSGRFAEDVAASLAGQVTILTDVYGAFYYSADRARVIESYYRALAVGGVALIAFDELAVTEVPEGDDLVPFPTWLAKRYPRIATVARMGSGWLLRLVRDPAVSELMLGLGAPIVTSEGDYGAPNPCPFLLGGPMPTGRPVPSVRYPR